MREVNQNIDQATHLRNLALNRKSFTSVSLPHVWTITSGKGGVGKSVIALNLAMLMAEHGKKVLLVDADENLGKLDMLCSVSPVYRTSDILLGKADVQGSVVSIGKNVYLLAGSSGLVLNAEISATDRQYLIEQIVHIHDGITDIVFDTGAGINAAVLQYASAANDTIIISHHEPTAVMDAYATIKLIAHHSISTAPLFRLIMNNSNSPTESDESAEKLQIAVRHFLRMNIDYLGSIPADERVSRSIREQTPLTTLFPYSAFGLSLGSICNRLLQIQTTQHHQLKEMVLA